MNNKPQFIQEILKGNTITNYLESKGIQPFRKNRYRCPTPSHNDSDPSFFVFEKDGYERYKCQGCGITGDVINLYAELEQVSLRRAFSHFVKDLDIEETDLFESWVNADPREQARYAVSSVSELSLRISHNCYFYLNLTDFDEEEVGVVEKALERIDEVIHSMDIKMLERLSSLMEIEILPKRKELFSSRQEEKLARAN